MKFTKMHGTGNDYIYVNGFIEQIDNPEESAALWSNRHTGIGSDGLVLILPSETCDFKMRMFNAYASESDVAEQNFRETSCFLTILREKR